MTVVMCNLVSYKMVKLPFFGSLNVPAGLICFPLTFFISDFVTEGFGVKRARQMVYLTLGMNVLALSIIQLCIIMPGTTLENDFMFCEVFNLSSLRIFSSLLAFSVAQLVDIQAYYLIKKWTGFRYLWLRVNGSTWIAQLADTLLIDYVFLYLGLHLSWQEIFSVMGFGICYKFCCSILLTPLFYFAVLLLKPRFDIAKR